MATAMKIKKGDTVQMLTGKDRGKQGRILDARPRDGKVIVENLNLMKKHQKPRPIRDAGRMGGTQIAPGGSIDRPTAGRRLERDARLPDLQAADARRLSLQGGQGRRRSRSASASAKAAARRSTSNGSDRDLYPAPQAALQRRAPRRAAATQLELPSIMQSPTIDKITLNMGVGEGKTDAKQIDAALEELTIIAGQRAQVRRARKSIAQFKIREGMPIGVKVTLRGDRMWEFLDRLVSIALPRIRDFRGLNPDSFDGRGNYSLGIREQIIFPEIDYDSINQIRGLDVAITTTATNDNEARALLDCARPPVRGRRREQVMAKKSLRVKAARPAKFKVRNYTRCNRCGRPRAVFKKFGLCRICLRELAHQGVIPGMTKSSW